MPKTAVTILFALAAMSATAESEIQQKDSETDERYVLPQIESIPITPRSATTIEPYQRLPPDKLQRLQELNNLAPGQVIPLQPQLQKPKNFPENSNVQNPRSGQSRFP